MENNLGVVPFPGGTYIKVIEYGAIDKEYAHEYDNLRVPKRVLYITIKNIKINIHQSENPGTIKTLEK